MLGRSIHACHPDHEGVGLRIGVRLDPTLQVRQVLLVRT
jgi:hypothetical protein